MKNSSERGCTFANEGKETWYRLLNWDRGQTPAERLATIILSNEKFHSIDPAHPLGGPDGLKDMVFTYGGSHWIGAVYFPRGQKTFKDIQTKFEHDIQGVHSNNSEGIVFFTNQELTLSERKKLSQIDISIDIQIYHLERIATLLNTPTNYGIRMEFLEIEMSREEQLAFFSSQNQQMTSIESKLKELTVGLEDYKIAHRAKFNETNLTDDCDDMRSSDQIIDASEEFFEKIWFDRHMSLKYQVENGEASINPEIWQGAMKSEQKMIAKYGDKNLGPYSDFEWGMINGKLSALRWVLGDEWDMLDT